MPFSSFVDPAQVARAHAALERAWAELHATGPAGPGGEDSERQRLAALIAGYAIMVTDEDELVERALERYRQGHV